jgi:hypothetical protein
VGAQEIIDTQGSRLYALADFIGFDFLVSGKVVTGSGKLKLDIGVGKVTLEAIIRSGVTTADTSHTALFLVLGSDLGISIFHTAKTRTMKVGLMKRSKLKNTASLFLDRDASNIAALEGLLEPAKPTYYEGQIGTGKFTKVV